MYILTFLIMQSSKWYIFSYQLYFISMFIYADTFNYILIML